MLQDVKVRVKKEIEMIFVLLRKPKCKIIEVLKRKLNLTQSGILERARAFQLGVTLHERRSAFCRCYCTNAYANDFCSSFLLWFFIVFPCYFEEEYRTSVLSPKIFGWAHCYCFHKCLYF